MIPHPSGGHRLVFFGPTLIASPAVADPHRIRLGALLAIAAAGLGAGCATVYQSPALNLATLEEPGEVQLSVHGGTPGVQISGAYAFHRAFAGRALIQADGTEREDDHFRHVALGASWFGNRPLGKGDDAAPMRGVFGASLDVGLFAGQGQFSLNVGGSTGTTTNRGAGVRTSLQGDVALSSPYFDVGMGGRFTHLYFQHAEGSRREGETAQAFFAEPVLFVRPGAPVFKLDLQVGLSLPVLVSGEIGLPLPVMVAVGGVLRP